MTAWRTRPEHAAVDSSGWATLPSGVEVTARPLVDTAEGLFARLTYRDALEVARRLGGRLPTREEVVESIRVAPVVLPPVTLSWGPEMVTKPHAAEHDRRVADLLAKRGNPAGLVAGIGKHWVAGAAPGRSRICGWPRPETRSLIQAGVSDVHDDQHHDYATTCLIVRELATKSEEPPPVRSTIRQGSIGDDVTAWQRIVGTVADGHFGPETARLTREWQRARGLVADAIVGAKSWALAGESWGPSVSIGDPRSPAAVAALRDADAMWPNRKRQSDGVMGDARHQKGKSGHNTGDAVDITHDGWGGCDGHEVARKAMTDRRVQYIIWNRTIWNVDRAAEGWRPYTGSNPHTHHVHIEIKPSHRADASPWPWAP